MEYALINTMRAKPTPNMRAICPCCEQIVIAKCGSINAWHWAHESADCDPWSEPESLWHRRWKEAFTESRSEVIIGPHRADIVTPSGRVIEFQASPISAEMIAEREAFYGEMIWLFRADMFIENVEMRKRDGFYSFRWKYPRKSLWTVRKPMYWDTGEDIFAIRKVYAEVPCGGYGVFLTYEKFAARAEGRAKQRVS